MKANWLHNCCKGFSCDPISDVKSGHKGEFSPDIVECPEKWK